MTRLYTSRDLVEVRLSPAPAGPVPEQFLWRGRLYLVLDVLARWTESGGWWRGAAVAALTTGSVAPAHLAGPLEVASIPSSPKWAQRAWGEPAPDVGAAVGPAGIDDREQQWWRVEAAAGRSSASNAGAGVYDLCFDESMGRWSLARVLD